MAFCKERVGDADKHAGLALATVLPGLGVPEQGLPATHVILIRGRLLPYVVPRVPTLEEELLAIPKLLPDAPS